MSSWLNKPKPKKQLNIIPQQVSFLSKNNTRPEIILPSAKFFEEYLYDNIIKKIHNFDSNPSDALITFIIPSMNRNTLVLTIKSLLSQNINNWKAIVIFDGCKPTDFDLINLLSDMRILYFSINKTGLINHNTHGAAGFVRNIGMNLVTTPWIGFIDDDDIILPNYTSVLLEEISLTPNVDLISFRMIDKNKIVPPDFINDIKFGYIGISFCYKTSLFREGFKFTQSEQEDYELINCIKNAKKKIILSPYITYIVRDSTVLTNTLKRIIIN